LRASSSAALAACATQQPVDRAATAAEERAHAECRRKAVGGEPTELSVLAAYTVDREAYAECMRQRGFSARPRR